MRLKDFILCLWGLCMSYGTMQGQEMTYSIVDQMPYFPGCEIYADGSEEKRNCSNQEVVEYIRNALKFPDRAKIEGLEGIVYISFIVMKNGSIHQAKILKDIGGGCGAEAINVIHNMPNWEPGHLKGEPVAVQLQLPIQFQFSESIEKEAYTLRWGKLNEVYEVSRKDIRRNVTEKVQVFNEEGMSIPLSDLTFSYNKNNKVTSLRSNGHITGKMQQMVKRLKRGSLFSVIATIQKEGHFLEIDKEFIVVR